ncbi:MAG: RNA polymerase sigma factor RpoD/SigA [Acidobacteriota bacterium]
MRGKACEHSPVIARYLLEISEFPLMSKQEEMALARDVDAGRKSPRSLNKLVQSNLSFVVKIASEYRGMGVPFEDLLNEGNLGLIEAANRYDYRRDTKFITYAIWWIRKSILRALAEHSNLVRLPTYQMKKLREFRRAERQLSRELGRKARREEISRKVGTSVAQLESLMQLPCKELSIDGKVGKDQDSTISDFLTDKKDTSAEQDLMREENVQLVRWALSSLGAQEKTILMNRFGLSGGQTLTLKEIGHQLGLSRERVRQIEVQAKRKIRRLFTSEHRDSLPCVKYRSLVSFRDFKGNGRHPGH